MHGGEARVEMGETFLQQFLIILSQGWRQGPLKRKGIGKKGSSEAKRFVWIRNGLVAPKP
jgi:hypothetical protein